MKNTELNVNLGKFVREFRLNTLKRTLVSVAREGNVNNQTLASFERGSSSNLTLIKHYFNACQNNQQKFMFNQGVDKIMMDDLYNDVEYREWLENQVSYE